MWHVYLLGLAVVGWWEYAVFAAARERAWRQAWRCRTEVIHGRVLAAFQSRNRGEAERWAALYDQAMTQWRAEIDVRYRTDRRAIPRRWEG